MKGGGVGVQEWRGGGVEGWNGGDKGGGEEEWRGLRVERRAEGGRVTITHHLGVSEALFELVPIEHAILVHIILLEEPPQHLLHLLLIAVGWGVAEVGWLSPAYAALAMRGGG